MRKERKGGKKKNLAPFPSIVNIVGHIIRFIFFRFEIIVVRSASTKETLSPSLYGCGRHSIPLMSTSKRLAGPNQLNGDAHEDIIKVGLL